MKRFRSRKNSPERNQGSRRPSLDSDPPSLPVPSWRWRKQKAAPESKPEINIAAALPASEDFRTSLLMPNLSARFSMLREQDDPLSKIGKANDDSVLFPKRASRLDLFKGHGLSEITDPDCFRGSIRRPFASTRTESYGSAGYDTDDGSVMSRSRPGEGNTMFGGRQKIYKIPVGGSGSVKKFGAKDDDELPSGVNMGGKALYESDIAMSAFQRLREEERQERERASSEHLQSSKEPDRDGSPPLAKYNRNRETTSSTNSGLSQPRMSTAATSVASQRSIYNENMGSFPPHALSASTQPSSAGSDRPFPKTSRRLYKQDLEQHMHEQQSSAMHRLESLNRLRSNAGGPGTRSLQQSRSATGLNDRYQRGGPLYTSTGFRAGSPPPSSTPPRMEEFDLGLVTGQAGSNLADSGYGRSPPLSPPMSPSHDQNNSDTTFLAALEPNDLGKATASGAFNKPRLQFDEQQYKERQIRLLEGRNTPSPQLIRPFSPQALSIDEQTAGRSRNNSLGSTFSRTESVKQPWEHHRDDRALRAVPERESKGSSHPTDEHPTNTVTEQNFLAERSSSDVAESESEAEPNFQLPPSTSKFPIFSHPMPQVKPAESKQELNFDPDAHSPKSTAEETTFGSRGHLSESTITQSKENNVNGFHADSPTLGAVGVLNGLSGLVHAHLRNDSGQSSIYPEDYPASDRSPVEVRQSIFGHESALNHSRQGSKDESCGNGEYWVKERRGSEQSSIVAPPPLSFAARHILQQATAIRDNQQYPNAQQMLANNKAQRVLGGEAPRSSHSRNNSTSWQDQLNAHHTRVGSTETQHEREGLANEMAERRRRVQASLKTYVEDNSRSPSPAPFVRPQDDGPAKSKHPFGILKTSRSSLVGKQERPSKAMKMLGMRPGEAGNDASQSPPDMFMGRSQFHDRAMPLSKKPSPPRTPQDLRHHPDNGSTYRQRMPNSGRSQENFAQRISPPPSKPGSSYSDNAEKRFGSGKDNNPLPGVDWNRVNGSNPITAAIGYESKRPIDETLDGMTRHGLPPTRRSQSAMSQRHPMSPIERSQSAMGGRLRSNSKPVSPSYFEPRVAPPGAPYMINPKQFSRVPPPGTPYMINPKTPSRSPAAHQNRHRAESTATSNESRPSTSSMASSPSTMFPPQISPSYAYNRPGQPRKRSINKQDISEPTFISCTSSVDTVNLPPGASLSNGMDSPSPTRGPPPPIPARDSRRKRTQTFLQALGRSEKPSETSLTEPTPNPREDDPYEERSTFSADDEPSATSKIKQRLRKSSSEGGLNAKAARQAALQAPSPAVPNFEVQSPGMDQHFPYQAQKDVPASAVMF